MPPSKRNRGATLAKSPPGSPIRPITKRPRQQTPKASGSSLPLPLPSRPIKAISTTTPTAFNSSQVDESEFKEERGRLSDESEVKEEEDNITQANEFLD